MNIPVKSGITSQDLKLIIQQSIQSKKLMIKVKKMNEKNIWKL